MNSVVVIGAGGFLGRAFVENSDIQVPVKAVTRNIPNDKSISCKNITWIEADAMIFSSLVGVLSEGDMVINLAYIDDNEKISNIYLIDNIIKACLFSKVSRLVHCSTAVVVGDTKTDYVSELSSCNPITPYEQTKVAVETRVMSALSKGLDVGILRPTAIVGHNGKNLLKLAHSLMYGNRFVNYLKACVLGRMPMHLVPVRSVVLALLHLTLSPKTLSGNIFIVSADEDVDNNFQKVEEILLDELGLKRTRFPYIPIPRILQLLVFKLANRNNINRLYDSKKLIDYGFKPVDSVDQAIRQFANSIKLESFIDLTFKDV